MHPFILMIQARQLATNLCDAKWLAHKFGEEIRYKRIHRMAERAFKRYERRTKAYLNPLANNQ